ncbi:MAG: hypothetical protein IJA83_11705 [Clostridia bacterium]|nr:hypothetical protein [Clostridia bacterium]
MIEKWFEPFNLLARAPVNDGLGAYPSAFAEDIPFRGVLVFTIAGEISAGGQPALEDTPTLLYDPDVTLVLGDRVRREKDGAIYRVCGGSMGAPDYSGLHFSQVKLERLVIPC